MNYSLFLCIIAFCCTCIKICLADCDNLQDLCPTDTSKKCTIFINGFPCKNPANATASDFKSTEISRPGDTDNIFSSAVTIVTAANFPGLNTLGLSIARTDLESSGLVTPHSHPRASEMFFVFKGTIMVGFIDTQNQLFQKTLKEGDVFVFPRGLLHFCFNIGFESATAFSVLNSQNPGVVKITDATFDPHPDTVQNIVRKLKSFSASEVDGMVNPLTLFDI